MKKSKIEELVESYHADVNCEALIAQNPYQKGWVKRLFGTQTEGIAKLQAFLESEAVSQLTSDDEIEGENLLVLLNIMYQREKRIYNTRRSYENYPEKSTNRVYTRLYHLLLLDAAIQSDMGIQFSHSKPLLQLLFWRIKSKVLADIEERIKEMQAEQSEKTNSILLKLGISLIFGKPLNHTLAREEEPDLDGLTQHIKVIQFEEQFVQVEFDFLNKELHEAKMLRAQIRRQDIMGGLEWLELASDNGHAYASLHLAAFYARRNDYSVVNQEVDRDKTVEYLNRARDQGSKLASQTLDEGLTFGMVSVSNVNCAYAPS